MSKVSIIVPVYNAGKNLNKCIKSIINQTFEEFELILVNDGSTDNSLNICRKYQRKDNRIVVIDKENEGSIWARRKGIEVSRTEYIMFVDADDWIDKNTLEILYNETLQSSVDITVCNMYKFLGSGRIIKKLDENIYFKEDKVYQKEEIKNLITAYLWGHPFPSSLCAKLYKKELLLNNGQYLDRIHFLGDDLYYNLEVFIKSNRVKIINRPLYYYRIGGFTSKYMPFLFNDMVSGYEIQKEVINEYFSENKQEQYNGISIMLLNTFKTCLYNLFNGEFKESNIKDLIKVYVSNKNIIECLDNEGSIKYFPKEYLSSIKNQDIEYLYRLGENTFKKGKLRRNLMKTLSRLSII